MTRATWAPWCCAAALTAFVSGCALTGKSDPLSPRYFTPEPALRSTDPGASAASGRELRLGRITASAHLAERIVYSSADHELGFYEDRRWSERPDVYLRRSLAQVLYEQSGVARVVSGTGPTLDVELTGFEEVRGPRPFARARATMLLYDGRVVLRERTFTVEQPMAVTANGAIPAEASVRALSEAMARLVGEVSNTVLATVPASHAGDPGQPGTDAGAAAEPANTAPSAR